MQQLTFSCLLPAIASMRISTSLAPASTTGLVRSIQAAATTRGDSTTTAPTGAAVFQFGLFASSVEFKCILPEAV